MVVDMDAAAADDEEQPAAPPLNLPVGLMVAIRTDKEHFNNNPPIIFSPISHQHPYVFSQSPPVHADNASITSPTENSVSDSFTMSDSPSTFSPSDSIAAAQSPPLCSRSEADAPPWMDTWMEMLNSKAIGVVRFLWSSFASSRGVFLNFHSAAATAAAAAVMFLYFRLRRRLSAGERRRNRLIGIIKERDELIKQLLDQLSQMNQVLLTLVRVSTA